MSYAEGSNGTSITARSGIVNDINQILKDKILQITLNRPFVNNKTPTIKKQKQNLQINIINDKIDQILE